MNGDRRSRRDEEQAFEAKDPFAHATPVELSDELIEMEVRHFLEEDVGSGDVTSAWTIPPGTRASGDIVAR